MTTPSATAATDSTESTDAAETTESTDDGRPPRVRFHAIGLSYHSTMFSTESEYGYTIMGPAVTYSYYRGRTWGFAIHGEIYFPLAGRYAGGIVDERGGLRDPYDQRRVGLDGLFMAATRRELTSKLVYLVGFGIHLQSFKLVGTNYIGIDGITGGIGALNRLDYRVSELFSIGAHLAFGLDPIDFVRHTNRATFTFPVSAGFSAGLTFD